LWAWKKRRIQLVRQYVRRMLVIFPFEEPFYRERGVDAEFVGHPLAELPPPAVSRAQFAAESGLDPSRTWIALLPGSRPREIADHLPEMLRAARLLAESSLAASNLAESSPAMSHSADGFQFVVPLAPTLNAAQRAAAARLVEEHGHGLAVRLVNDARAALLHARAAVVASGTATVEAALIGKPFVVVYRVSPATYAIARRVVTVPHVAMANLIAGRRVVPELIQHDFTAANIVQHLAALLPDGTPRQSMVEGLKSIRDALSRRPEAVETVQAGAIERVAVVTMEELRQAAASAVQS
jgi:lipid-A-disaccharide synthase